MKPNKQTFAAAKLFTTGHDEVIFEAEYGDEVAYYVHDYANDGACVGYPLYVLVDKNLNCRYSDWQESLAIMDIKNTRATPTATLQP